MSSASPPLLNLLSGYRPANDWSLSPTPRPSYTRQLGLVELKFDLAAKDLGQSDTFLQLTLAPSQSQHSAESLFARLSLAWARLRALHPALACRVEDGPAPAEERPTREGYVRVPGRKFVYEPPQSEVEALERALDCVLVEKVEGMHMREAVEQLVVNGERVTVGFDCLARLLVFPHEADGVGLVLCISHTISDGLSVLNLVAELLRLLSDADLPTPATLPAFLAPSALLSSPRAPIAKWDLPAYILTPWQLVAPPSDIPSLLSPASEDLYPLLPLAAPSDATAACVPPLTDAPTAEDLPPAGAPAHPSAARQRWTWLIARVIEQIRNARYPRSPKFPRLPANADAPLPQAHTRWPVLRLSRETSSKLIALCKAHKLSPSMLLFSILALTTSSLLSRDTDQEELPDIVFGFPYSLRPCLTGDDGTEQPERAVDLAIRIGFDCIHLPGLLPHQGEANGEKARERTRLIAIRGARLAKEQFKRRLAAAPESRTSLMCSQYYLILDRLLNSLKNNPIPLRGPAGALNASMIGDVDRLLPAKLTLPKAATHPETTFALTNLVIGTRLHRGEGMLIEAFTFEGRITVCLGWDEECVARETVEAVLAEVERIAGEVAGA